MLAFVASQIAETALASFEKGANGARRAMWTPVDAYAGLVASRSSSTRESALLGASQALNLISAQAVYRSQIPQGAQIVQVGLDSLTSNFLDRGGGCT